MRTEDKGEAARPLPGVKLYSAPETHSRTSRTHTSRHENHMSKNDTRTPVASLCRICIRRSYRFFQPPKTTVTPTCRLWYDFLVSTYPAEKRTQRKSSTPTRGITLKAQS